MILVVGGSRGTGRLVVERLVAAQRPVRVLARRPDRIRGDLSPQVEVVAGDITRAETLPAAFDGAEHVIFTAGCRSGWPATEREVRATEYEGVRAVLASAGRTGVAGRFVYMTSSGVGTQSLWTRGLNAYKGNTLHWRRRAEESIRQSGLAHVILRAGFLLNGPGGRRPLWATQEDLPLTPRYRIARADVAAALVAALDHPAVARTTFDLVWARTPTSPLEAQLFTLRADRAVGPARAT